MAIQISMLHQTTYQYSRPIFLSPHLIRLRPAAHCRTPILSYSLSIEPKEHLVHWQQDPFGNYLARLLFSGQVEALNIKVEMRVDMTVINPFDFFLEDFAASVPFSYSSRIQRDLGPFLEVSESSPEFESFLKNLPSQSGQTSLEWLSEMNYEVYQLIGYTQRFEQGVQSCAETLKKQTGSCRDTSWLLIQAFRKLGYGARFVSGYLIQLMELQTMGGMSQAQGADITALHAWVEVYLPGAGWVGLDPTSGLFAGEGHIPLACTSDTQSAAAIEGKAEACEVEFSYKNEITRIPS